MKFHNEHYDGIIIKLDKGFILTNPKLVEHIKAFEEALKSCEYSLMLPDYQRNLNELSDYEEKSDVIKQNEEEEQRFKNAQIEKWNKLATHEIVPIKEKEFGFTLGERPYFSDKRWEHLDIFNKKTIKTSFIKALNTFLENATEEEIADFKEYNGVFERRGQKITKEKLIGSRIKLDSYGNLRLMITFPYVEWYERGKRDKEKLYFRVHALFYDEDDKQYYITHGCEGSEKYEKDGLKETRFWFNNYENKIHSFIKNK